VSRIKQLINEYPEDYCHSLEFAYGEGMMSEGGDAAIDDMFNGITLQNKQCLDVGSGLGGVAFYLAEKYHAYVSGLEINSWMQRTASERIPEHLKSHLAFYTYTDINHLPFNENKFDIVYSKGVLVHVEDKLPLFKEFRRVLKPTGHLVIEDWLSPVTKQWGPIIERLCAVENLSLFAESTDSYQTLLNQAGFDHITASDQSKKYYQYNLDIVKRLSSKSIKSEFIARFGENAWTEALEGYQLIAHAIQKKELLVMRLVIS